MAGQRIGRVKALKLGFDSPVGLLTKPAEARTATEFPDNSECKPAILNPSLVVTHLSSCIR